MNYPEFDNAFRAIQFIENIFFPPILLWYHFNRRRKKPSRILPLIISAYLLWAGLYAGRLFFLVQPGWAYIFKIWLINSIHTFHWRYDWYCALIFLTYIPIGLGMLWHTFHRKTSAGQTQTIHNE